VTARPDFSLQPAAADAILSRRGLRADAGRT
jgi:hypothetical protein